MTQGPAIRGHAQEDSNLIQFLKFRALDDAGITDLKLI